MSRSAFLMAAMRALMRSKCSRVKRYSDPFFSTSRSAMRRCSALSDSELNEAFCFVRVSSKVSSICLRIFGSVKPSLPCREFALCSASSAPATIST